MLHIQIGAQKTVRGTRWLLTAAMLFAMGTNPGLAEQKDVKKGDYLRGLSAWQNNCARCHNVRDPREYSDVLWKPVITHMRIRAGLTGQQARDILTFFAKSH